MAAGASMALAPSAPVFSSAFSPVSTSRLPFVRNIPTTFFLSKNQTEWNIQLSCMPVHQSGIQSLMNPSRNNNQEVFASTGKAFLSGGSITSFKQGLSVLAAADVQCQSEAGMVAKKYAWVDGKRPKLCILGGGFGGLYTALQLESLVWSSDKKPEVVIIDQSARFVFKPMLYELLSKEADIWEVAPPIKDLLEGTNMHFEQDKVKKILLSGGGSSFQDSGMPLQEKQGTVVLASGLEIDYDWLLLALGSESNKDIVPGAAEYAFPFSSLEDVLEIERQLKTLERKRFGSKNPPIHLVVVGAGYCGVELAATLAERLGDRGKVQIVDVTPDICISAPAGNREAAYKVLSSRGVELILGVFASEIKKVSENEKSTGEQSPYLLELRSANKVSKRTGQPSLTLQADMIFWTAGGKPALPSEIAGSGFRPFPLNGKGQVEIDETLRVKGHPQIFAIGDSAFVRDSSGQPLQGTAQVAFQQAAYCGWNLWAAINNRPLLPFRYQNLGEAMILGRNDAAVTVGGVNGITLEGPLGHTARKFAYLYRLPTDKHRAKVGLSWFIKSTVDGVASLQDAFTTLFTRT